MEDDYPQGFLGFKKISIIAGYPLYYLLFSETICVGFVNCRDSE